MQRRGWRHFGSRWSRPNPLRSLDQPLSTERPRQRRATLLAGGVILGTVAGWFLFADRWMIQSIEVTSQQGSPSSTQTIQHALDQQRRSFRWGVIPQSHRLFFDQEQAQERIRRIVLAQHVAMEFAPEHVLRVKLTKPSVELIVRNEALLMAIDEQGRAFEVLPESQASLDAIAITVPSPVSLGTVVFTPQEVQWYRLLDDTAYSTIGAKLKGLKLDGERPKTIILELEQGPIMTLDRGVDPQEQLQRLRLFLASSKRALDQLHRVDLRFGATIFYQ